MIELPNAVEQWQCLRLGRDLNLEGLATNRMGKHYDMLPSACSLCRAPDFASDAGAHRTRKSRNATERSMVARGSRVRSASHHAACRASNLVASSAVRKCVSTTT